MKSTRRIKYETEYGKPMKKLCKSCSLPQSECACETKKPKTKGWMKPKNNVRRKPTKLRLSEFRQLIRHQLLIEASANEIQNLVGKEAAIKYKKKDGTVKTYFGRVTKTTRDSFFMGVLNKGLRKFYTDQVLSVSPTHLEESQIKWLDEHCGHCPEDLVQGPLSKVKEFKDTSICPNCKNRGYSTIKGCHYCGYRKKN